MNKENNIVFEVDFKSNGNSKPPSKLVEQLSQPFVYCKSTEIKRQKEVEETRKEILETRAENAGMEYQRATEKVETVEKEYNNEMMEREKDFYDQQLQGDINREKILAEKKVRAGATYQRAKKVYDAKKRGETPIE